MGKSVQKIKKVDARNIEVERTDHPDPRANKPGRRPKSEVGEADATEIHHSVLKHFFPDFVNWLKEVRDPRKNVEACTYPI